MSLVVPTPVCVESLHGRGAAARYRRGSAALVAERRSSAPARRSSLEVSHEPLARSRSQPAAPAALLATACESTTIPAETAD